MTTPAVAVPDPCPAHHWLLPVADGPVVEGRCRTCGAVREFRTRWDGWDDGERGRTINQEPPSFRERREPDTKRLRNTSD